MEPRYKGKLYTVKKQEEPLYSDTPPRHKVTQIKAGAE